MYRFIAIVFVLWITTPLRAQETVYLSRSLSADHVSKVIAKTSGGNIEVSGGHDQDARLEVYVSSNGHRRSLSRDEIAQRIGADYDFTVSVQGGELSVSALPKHHFSDWKNALNISFKIYVPENTGTDLATSGGSISLTKLSGDEVFKTSGGNLEVGNLSGKIRGETSGGSIRVSDSRDDIDLSTSGGNINASQCNGQLKLSTSGGSIDLSGLDGNIHAATSGGSVRAKTVAGELVASTSGGSLDLEDLSCSLDASTSGGHINIAMTNPGKYVKVSNSGGHINLSIPGDKGYDLKLYGNGMDRDFSLKNFSGTVKKDRIEGTVNGGGIPVTASSSGGHINLSFN